MIKADILSTKAVEKLEQATPAIMAAIMRNFPALLIRMQTSVKDKLSGPVLKRRTGTLSRSIHYGHKQVGPNAEGKIWAGPEAPYAGVHEYGGTFVRPTHTRMQTMVYGRPISPVEVTVKAHSATYPVRSFLRTTLEENRERFREMIIKSINQAAA